MSDTTNRRKNFPQSADSERVGVDDRRLVRLLESRHEAMLEWYEPWPARGPQDNQISAHVTLRATVHDCINLARNAWHDRGCEHLGMDRELLLDFIAVNWATIFEPNVQREAPPRESTTNEGEK